MDCSATFGARYVAKNIVAAGLAKRCSVQIAYAIGIAKPISIYVNTFGAGQIGDDRLGKIVADVFDLTPRGMIEAFDLLSSKTYKKIARNLFLDDYPWEKTDKVNDLRQAAG